MRFPEISRAPLNQVKHLFISIFILKTSLIVQVIPQFHKHIPFQANKLFFVLSYVAFSYFVSLLVSLFLHFSLFLN